MIEDQFLPYFITEDIFQVVGEVAVSTKTGVKSHHTAPTQMPVPDAVVEQAELAIWTPPLTSKDRELLSNILKAIKKELTGVLLMEGIASYQPHFKVLVCFGYQKELELKTGKSIPLYQPLELEGRTFLVSVPPATLHDDKNEKSRLWTALKELFAV